MDFSELLINRRSVRHFRDEPVDMDVISEIIAETTLAPSSGNGQPWKFIIIRDTGLMKRLSDESKANILKTITENPEHSAKKYEGVLKSETYNVFYNAPALVIIAGPRDIRSTFVDCSLAASYFMFSAANKGLGTCWINLGSDIRDWKLLEEIGLPDDCVIVAPIIIGHPTTIPKAPPRNQPEILKVLD